MSLLQYTLEKERKKGQQEGWQKGQQARDREMVLNMLKNHLDTNLICKVTGLSIDELKKLKNGANS